MGMKSRDGERQQTTKEARETASAPTLQSNQKELVCVPCWTQNHHQLVVKGEMMLTPTLLLAAAYSVLSTTSPGNFLWEPTGHGSSHSALAPSGQYITNALTYR
jgi:hypothetical protein